jgi:hypothetical protein
MVEFIEDFLFYCILMPAVAVVIEMAVAAFLIRNMGR